MAIAYFGNKVKSNVELAKIAITQNKKAFNHIAPELKNRQDIRELIEPQKAMRTNILEDQRFAKDFYSNNNKFNSFSKPFKPSGRDLGMLD